MLTSPTAALALLPLLLAPAAAASALRSALDDQEQPAPAAATLEQRLESIWVLVDERRVGEALAIAAALAAEHEGSARAHGINAFLLLNTGQVEQGERALERARSLDRHAPEVVLIEANRAAQRGDVAGALAAAREARQAHPEEPILFQLEGDVLMAQRRFQEAANVFANGLAHCTSDRQKLGLVVKAGQAASQAGDFETMESAMTAALRLRDDLRFVFTRAEARTKLGKHSLALEDCAALLRREDVRADVNGLGQVRNLREQALAAYAATAGPIEPLVWALRWSPGDEGLETRLADAVAEIRAAGESHPYHELVPLPEIVVEEPPIEPYRGELTDEDRAEMEELGVTEEEYRVQRGETEALVNALVDGNQAWRKAAGAQRIRIPEVLEDARADVSDELWSEVGTYLERGDWDGLRRLTTQQAAVYPESRAYLERAWARFMLGRVDEALADARVGLAVESLEVREDRLRPFTQGFGLSRLTELRELEASLSRILADRPNDSEKRAMDGLAAARDGRWVEALEHMLAAAPLTGAGSRPFESRVREQFVRSRGQELGDALSAEGMAALAAEDEERIRALESALTPLFLPHGPSYAFLGQCAERRGELDMARVHYRSAVYHDPLGAAGHLRLGRLAEAQGDQAGALGHYNAGAGPVADVNATTGDARLCAEARSRLEQATGDAAAVYKAYADLLNPLLKLEDRTSEAVVYGGLTRLLAMNGPPVQLRNFRMWRAYRLELWERGLADAEWLLAQTEGVGDDVRASCYDLKGSALRKLERPAEAVDVYRAFAELQPTNSHPLEQLGFTLQGLERDEEALAAFDGAVERGSENAFVWMERGELLARQARWSEAADSATKAADLASAQQRTGLAVRASGSALDWAGRALNELFNSFDE